LLSRTDGDPFETLKFPYESAKTSISARPPPLADASPRIATALVRSHKAKRLGPTSRPVERGAIRGERNDSERAKIANVGEEDPPRAGGRNDPSFSPTLHPRWYATAGAWRLQP